MLICCFSIFQVLNSSRRRSHLFPTDDESDEESQFQNELFNQRAAKLIAPRSFHHSPAPARFSGFPHPLLTHAPSNQHAQTSQFQQEFASAEAQPQTEDHNMGGATGLPDDIVQKARMFDMIMNSGKKQQHLLM